MLSNTVTDTYPATVYRVVRNRAANDWNSEPDYRIIKYTVCAHDTYADKYWVETPGWPGFVRRHWLNNKGLHTTLDSAQAELAERTGETC